jgi:beta-phosphoglucomutase-like phosphatase (HAD superfamily)
MSSTTEAQTTTARASAGTPPPAALIFELEGVALATRQVLFELARDFFAARRLKLDQGLFARCGGTIAHQAAQLAAAAGSQINAAELTQSLSGGLSDRLSANALKLNSGLDRVLKAAAARNLPIAAVTGLPESCARRAADAAGLDTRGIELYVFNDDDKPFPRADAWLKVVKQLGKTPRFCVAFGSSHASCKSALSAGMRSVAVPDSFTSHQDFGGADLILDSWDDISAAELLDALIPPLR